MREVVDHRAMPGVMAKKKSPRRIVRGMKPSFWDNPFQGGDRNALVYVFTRRHAILLLRHLRGEIGMPSSMSSLDAMPFFSSVISP
jgi:hypothetical protein